MATSTLPQMSVETVSAFESGSDNDDSSPGLSPRFRLPRLADRKRAWGRSNDLSTVPDQIVKRGESEKVLGGKSSEQDEEMRQRRHRQRALCSPLLTPLSSPLASKLALNQSPQDFDSDKLLRLGEMSQRYNSYPSPELCPLLPPSGDSQRRPHAASL